MPANFWCLSIWYPLWNQGNFSSRRSIFSITEHLQWKVETVNFVDIKRSNTGFAIIITLGNMIWQFYQGFRCQSHLEMIYIFMRANIKRYQNLQVSHRRVEKYWSWLQSFWSVVSACSMSTAGWMTSLSSFIHFSLLYL